MPGRFHRWIAEATTTQLVLSIFRAREEILPPRLQETGPSDPISFGIRLPFFVHMLRHELLSRVAQKALAMIYVQIPSLYLGPHD